jgi:hypothetical protein
MGDQTDLERLVALLEEHGIVPERGTPERPGESWGLTNKYIVERVRQAEHFPMTPEEVERILTTKK